MSQGPIDQPHPVSPDGKWIWNGTDWVPHSAPAPPTGLPNASETGEGWVGEGGQTATNPPLGPTHATSWYKRPLVIPAVAIGLALLIIGALIDDSATETPPTTAAGSAEISPTPLSVDETYEALVRWWDSNDDANRSDFCSRFRGFAGKLWSELSASNQDQAVTLSRPAFDEFMPNHCARDGAVRAVAKPREGAQESAAPAEDEPTEEPSAYDYLGVFDPIKKSGRGDSVVKLGDAATATAVAVKATHKGESNFVVKSLDADNDSVELLVNEIGKYSGTTLLMLDGEKRLKIAADGPWTITLSPIADMKEIDPPIDGKGDSVVRYSGSPSDWRIKHKGDSNFVVKQFADDGTDLLINEIGKYSGVQPVGPGPSIVTILADGSWSITPN